MDTIQHVIIGGGISGCYIALQLLLRGIHDFVILEAKGHHRGKQRSIHHYVKPSDPEAVTLELGSSVFHSRQHRLLSLLRYLDLDSQIREESSGKAYYTYPGLSSSEVKSKFNALQARLKELAIRIRNESTSYPTLTVNQLVQQQFTPEEADLLRGCYPEWFEIADMNAYSYGISEKFMGKWYRLEGGLGQILDECTEILHPYLRFHQPVFDVEKREDGSYIVDVVGEFVPKIQASHVYLCCNLKSAQRDIVFRGCPNVQRYLSMGEYKPSLRYYIILRRDIQIPYQIISGPSIGQTSTLTKGSWVCKFSIQITPRVWLISYPDGELVDRIIQKDLSKNLLDLWIQQMNLTFDLDLKMQDVKHTEVAMWNDAFSILKEGWYHSFSKDPRLTHCVQDGILITCLPQMFDQAWMEGHLFVIPNEVSRAGDRFVDRIQRYAKEKMIAIPTGPILSAAILPVSIAEGQLPSFLVGKEARGEFHNTFNLFGGKVSDREWVNFEGALRGLFEEIYEEFYHCIDIEAFIQSMIGILFKENMDGSYAMVLVVQIDAASTEGIMQKWKTEHDARMKRVDDLPLPFTEMSDIESISVTEVSRRDNVTLYVKEVVEKWNEKMADKRANAGLQPHHLVPVRINSLGIVDF